jgi:S-DNA-T family DNA segregation ATPase FtsK/SpoIIIE
MNRKHTYFLVVSLVALAAFTAVALASAHYQDWPFTREASFGDVRNLSGPLGSLLAFSLIRLFGSLLGWVFPIGCAIVAGGLLVKRSIVAVRLLVKLFVITVLLTSFLELMPFDQPSTVRGTIGVGLARLVSSVLGNFGGTIAIITLLLLILMTELRQVARVGVRGAAWVPVVGGTITGWANAVSSRARRAVEEAQERRARDNERGRELDDDNDDGIREESRAARTPQEAPVRASEPKAPRVSTWSVGGDEPRQAASPEAPRPAKAPKRRTPRAGESVPLAQATLPPVTILKAGADKRVGYSQDQLESWSEVLEGKLANYGVAGNVTAVNQGPVVTTFEFEPEAGVKVKDIVSRADDLALAMRARSLRLIAPIPGRAVVGIEIPNPEHATVYFRDVLREIPERLRYSGIMIAMGVDAVGKPFHMNLCSAPHLLMAGTTGSGKSVALNSFLASILFQYRATDVRLLIIDPKMVEMSGFNGIPHLLHPVITDPREAVRVFNYLISEMESRNHLLRKHGVKNIESFNSKIALGKIDGEEPVEKLPYIVLVVDEMADLVLTKGIDFEAMLSRLSNMARAVGIHMVVATQRPSVDVIDGKTKANFPTRIAFRVASKVDSRTILDCGGAEKLLGNGDMLYVDAKHPEGLRVHGSWLPEEELEEMLNHWRSYEFEESHLDFEEEGARDPVSGDEKDSYFDDAKDIVVRYGQGSTSLLQRKLRVGYARAARLLDQLESAGVVGPPDGSKAREVLVRREEQISPNLNE